MSKAFFLSSILPSLKIGGEPGISFEDLMRLYKDNISRSDLKKVERIRTFIDLKNIQALLKKRGIDHRGNLTEKGLEEAIVNQEGLPEYLFDHLESSESDDEALNRFSKVFIAFFNDMEKEEKGFLKRYFAFERDWRVLLSGYRAKKVGIDIACELQYEDFDDPLIAEVLAQKEAPFFEFPFEYRDLGEKLKGSDGKPKEQYEIMAAYRFNRVGDAVQDHPFSIDYLLGYMVQQMIVEDVYALDEKQGNQTLSEIVKGSI